MRHPKTRYLVPAVGGARSKGQSRISVAEPLASCPVASDRVARMAESLCEAADGEGVSGFVPVSCCFESRYELIQDVRCLADLRRNERRLLGVRTKPAARSSRFLARRSSSRSASSDDIGQVCRSGMRSVAWGCVPTAQRRNPARRAGSRPLSARRPARGRRRSRGRGSTGPRPRPRGHARGGP